MIRFVLIILGTMVVSNLIAWFALHSILVRLDAPSSALWCLGAYIILQIVSVIAIIGGRLAGHQPGTGMGRPLLTLSMIWNMLLALPTAAISVIWLGIWVLLSLATGFTSVAEPWRTIGLVAVSLPFAITLAGTLSALWQLSRFRINRIKLTIPNLPAALKGLTIVHLSDLHIGKLTRGKVLDDMVTTTNQLDADLILVTGDLINMSLEDLPKGLDMLRAMKSRYGVYSCEGNHDLIEDENGFEKAVKESGVPFLLNESVTLSIKGQPVQILGIRYGEGMGRGRNVPGAALDEARQWLNAKRQPNDFTILLAHHPTVFDAAVAAHIPLTLAGHTHGGQLMLTEKTGFGPWLFKYWSGLYAEGDSRMVVSNGTGNWFPLRINSPAEIIHLTLE